jgi:hypothetical protein
VATREHIHPVTGKRHTFTDLTTVDIRKELETAIINRNQRHFAQAEGTPITVPPLRFINSDSEFNVYKDVADNDVVLPDIAFIETTTVLDILKERAKNPTTEWEPKLDFNHFLSSLLHWRETTSTSPSSRHLGLYKAVATVYCNSNEEFTNPADSDDPFDIPTQEKVIKWTNDHLRSKNSNTVSIRARHHSVLPSAAYPKVGDTSSDARTRLTWSCGENAAGLSQKQWTRGPSTRCYAG